jgi:hypothetical protein
VLDCARDPAIYRLLLESRLEFLCLYSGKLPRELELVAPHIVELLPGHHFTQRLLDEGWGRAWGIFVRIADPTALRSNLRKLLRVQARIAGMHHHATTRHSVIRLQMSVVIPRNRTNYTSRAKTKAG